MNPSPAPQISVIVPTFRRPDLVRRAVASALAQTAGELEVVVVIDGDDAGATANTRRSLDALADPRVRVLETGRTLGNGAARNAGVAAARGSLVALLDDDDEWFPGKLAAQLPLAGEAATLVTCRLEARVGGGETHLWPRRLPRGGEPLGEYLFCPRRPGTGEGMVQTSTWLLPTDLLRRVPFAEGLRRYVDLDWLLRAAGGAAGVVGFRVAFAGWPEALCAWNIEPDRVRVSNGDNGRFALDFARDRRGLMTRRAYAGFVLSLASQSAAAAGRRPGYWAVLRAALDGGRPTAAGLVGHTLHYAVPRSALRWAAARARRPAPASRRD